jgi:hypothetical protein
LVCSVAAKAVSSALVSVPSLSASAWSNNLRRRVSVTSLLSSFPSLFLSYLIIRATIPPAVAPLAVDRRASAGSWPAVNTEAATEPEINMPYKYRFIGFLDWFE